MPLMSLKEYAAHRGVSPAAVTIAVKSGRCPVELDPMGVKKIDSEKADAQWVSGGGAGNPPGTKQQKPQENTSSSGSTIIQSRTVKEAYAARMAKLDYEERIGKTIEAEKVREDAFKAARIIRDNMLNIPDRLAAEVAGETNQFVIHKKITEEIKKAIQDAINTIRNQETTLNE